MKKELLSPGPLVLIGDANENFYQLGVKDKQHGKIVHEYWQTSLTTPIAKYNDLIKNIGLNFITPSENKLLLAYAEGMDKSIKDVTGALLIPELLGALGSLSSDFFRPLIKTRSQIFQNTEEDYCHAIFNEMTYGPFLSQYQRHISYQLNDLPKMYSFSLAGLPFPGPGAFSEHGVSLSISQVLSSTYVAKGKSIFEIAFELLTQVTTKEEAKSFLKCQQTFSAWELTLGFKNGESLSCVLAGDSCQFFDKNIFVKSQSEPEALIALGHPNEALQIQSLHAGVFNLSAQTCYYLSGEGAKISHLPIRRITRVFNEDIKGVELSAKETKKITPKKHILFELAETHAAYRYLTLAQLAFDQKKPQEIYHNLQLAIDHLERSPLKNAINFYFLIAEYMYETHEKTLFHVLHELRLILNEGNQLPHGLQDHLHLFILRLEKSLGLTPTTSLDNIQEAPLKEVAIKEQKIPKLIFHFTTRNLIVPRLDLFKIIYYHHLIE